jgi:Na+/H+ antiporter NhaD/arsenite permease-like protein
MVTSILSAFLDNVTLVLLVAPVTVFIANEFKINSYPLLFSEINASNTAETATRIGDPPTTRIGSATSPTFNDFVLH